MPKTPCRASGCKNLVNRKDKGYCETHAHMRYGWAKVQARQGSSSQRGYGSAWRKLRTAIMERDGYLCQVCLKADRLTPAHAVDHIINKASGGTDDPSNLQAICHACHRTKTQNESRRGGGG